MNQWSQFRPISKLDQLAETIMKTAFIMSEDHHVIQSYVEHKGANFRVVNRVGESEFDILCRQINIEKTNYTFITKSDLERGLRDLWIGLVLFIDGQKPTKYLIPSVVWNEPNQLLANSVRLVPPISVF
ncbi:hypothetical protein JMN32_21075 [Fulvivirga sp. 29W222]|uniref:Uncharacterized protein n=1 Tax=Fulvivirga marina TaxID=2494733 RepID=A0A937KG47_9BACT|nr:hypothetical protein [Fulvivirga marina]MBL6448818.1 hypothetical protein [Fulvivirga marina]